MTGGSGAGGSAPSELPRPFYDHPWTGNLQADARAFWDWHLTLLNARANSQWREGDADTVLASEDVSWIPASISRAAQEACARHRQPLSLLADQVAIAPRLWAPVRFVDAGDLDEVVRTSVGAHARLLAALAGADHSWQVPAVVEFGRGLYLTGRILTLPDDLRGDRQFIPQAELEQSGVSLEHLLAGKVDAAVKRLLWKQVVRARDALARGTPLAAELEPRYARAMRRWWMDALEVLNEVERREFDLWSRPLALAPIRRLQARLLALFGRTTFRRR
ncbi:MAG TPA: squalene/phytoene synthase family protein [Rhodothermales bacterium]